uniref:Calpain catalytic domain-containing protein n=1 Tax=Anopheles christyi TaxID=43041 RepID=A0A182K7Q0_9DIPT
MHFIRWWLESEDLDGDRSANSHDQSHSRSSTEVDTFKEQPTKEDFISLRTHCLAKGNLFEDPEFPANNFSIYQSNPPQNGARHIEWKRPGEIVPFPKFVTEGYSRFDVRQGILGNCWFISSCATLTSHPELFDRVVPQDNGQFEDDHYAGMFHFYFWKYGQWREVIVDDRLPVGKDNKLLYISSSVEDEFWGALLEKAYAKLHGSYEALDGGTGREGMVDLTGGITEFYKLKGYEPEDLFERVERNLARRSLLTAGIGGDERGILRTVNLVPKHEYSVTKVTRIDAAQHMLDFGDGNTADVRLICVRNPWGSGEWSGAWGDNSIEWIMVNDETMAELNIVKEDGEFWMSFQDFVQHFDDISVCYQCPGDMGQDLTARYPWEMVTEMGEWKRTSTAGGSDKSSFWRNPQYFLKLTETEGSEAHQRISLTIGLMQKHHRAKGTNFLSLRLLVYPIPDHVLIGNRPLPKTYFDNVVPIETEAKFETSREIVARYQVPPGRYVAVPHTWKPQQEAQFMLRIFAEGRGITYPTNWNANGLGWINPAAFAQSPPASQWPTVPTPGSSGYSSLNPSISGQSLSYGFNPNVMPALPDSGAGYSPASSQLPYPTMGFAAFGTPMDYTMPNLPPPVPEALLRGSEPVAGTCEEIPFQAISIPIAEGMFSPLVPQYGRAKGMEELKRLQFLLKRPSFNNLTIPAFKGLLSGAGKQLFDKAGQAITSAATEYIGSVINEMFVKKETDTKRFLPSIKNMKVVKNGV